MKRTAVTRIAGDICFYFAILSSFAVFRTWQVPMAGFVLACVVAGLVAAKWSALPVRIIAALLPGVCFLFMDVRPLLFFPALAWLYFGLVIGTGRFAADLYEYRNTYRLMAVICLFFVLANAANSALFKGSVLSMDSLVYLMAFLVLGVVSMRSMRMDADMDVRWRAANALTIIAAILLAAVISLALYVLLSRGRTAISYLFAPLGRLILWLLSFLPKGEADVLPTATPQPTPQVNPFSSFSNPNSGAARIEVEPNEHTLPGLVDQAAEISAYIAMVLLAAGLVYLVVKLVRRGEKVQKASGPEYEGTEDFTPESRRKARREKPVRGNAERVRKLYREYLDFLGENGLRRDPSQTSEDVLAESERISGREDEDETALRQIYLKARYSAETVTDEDVTAAKKHLEQIRRKGKTE